MELYRIIQLDFKDRILKGYADPYSSGNYQTEEWKEFTKNIHKMQKDLYFKGFPCFEVGKIYDVNGVILYEEFSKKKITLDKRMTLFTDREILRLLDYSLLFGVFYFPYLQYSLKDVFSYDNRKRLKVYDIARIRYMTIEDWNNFVNDGIMYLRPGQKKLIFKVISKNIFKKKGNSILWKSLFLVESVRRKLVHHFRKDITSEIMASQSNASIILYGKKLQSLKEKCLEEASQKTL